MGTVRRAAKNLLSLSSAQIISQVIYFLIIVYLARTLGAANFGKISFAQAVVLYFMLIGNLGLSVLGVREVARDKGRIDSYASSIVSLRLALALLSFILLLGFTSLINKSAEIKHLIIFYGFSLFSSALLIEWLFQGIEKMEFIGISRILNRVVFAALVFLFIKSSRQLLLIPYLWLGGGLAAASFLFYIFGKQFGRIRLRFNLPSWKSLVRRALPMGAAFIMIQVYYNFDILMLGFMKGEEVVGWYNAAYKLIFLVLAFIPIFINVIFPLMSKYYQESREKLETLISSSTRLLTTIALPLGIGGTLLARPIMGFLYGENFSPGIIGFQILIWSVVIIYMRCTYEQSFLACDQEKRYLFGVILGAATNIGLNIVLIPYFSLKGAAIATVISEFVFSAYMFSYFRIVSRRQMVKYPLKPFIAAALMGFVVYYTAKFNLFFSISMGIVSYLAFILLLKGITPKEIVELKQQIARKE